MNVFLTEKPKVAVRVDRSGNLVAAATNIHDSVEVIVCYSDDDFKQASSNLPFELKSANIH